eukprot:6472813-Amphidinium_carterae.1
MARFEQHQHRQLCSNAFDESAEPAADASPFGLKHEKFMKMVAPMFSQNSTQEDIMAVMKRANTVVLGQHRVYVRKPGASKKMPID